MPTKSKNTRKTQPLSDAAVGGALDKAWDLEKTLRGKYKLSHSQVMQSRQALMEVLEDYQKSPTLQKIKNKKTAVAKRQLRYILEFLRVIKAFLRKAHSKAYEDE